MLITKPNDHQRKGEQTSACGRSDGILRALAGATSVVAGDAFFRALLQTLARELGIRWAFVAENLPNSRIRTLVFWDTHEFGKGSG